MIPGDFDYSRGRAVTSGAYVDLGDGGQAGGEESDAGGPFSNKPTTKSLSQGIPNVSAIYDTWSFHYEHDGQSQRGGGSGDGGTDGIESNGQSGIDDGDERETAPPYPLPLRGLQVKVRCYEPELPPGPRSDGRQGVFAAVRSRGQGGSESGSQKELSCDP